MPTPFPAEIRLLRPPLPAGTGPLMRLPQGLAITALLLLLATGAIDGMLRPEEHATTRRLSHLADRPQAWRPAPAQVTGPRLALADEARSQSTLPR